MNEQNNNEEPEPRWYDSELASCIGMALVIVAIGVAIGGCNYLSKLP